MNKKPMLFASLLLDRPGSRTARQLGKIQASSLLKFFFNGDILLWRNFPEMLYMVERKGLYEVEFLSETPLQEENGFNKIAQCARLKLKDSLGSYAERYSWLIFAHEDVMALRNWDHLFDGVKEDLLVSKREDGTLDTGFFAVRSEIYISFLKSHKRVISATNDFDFLERIIEEGHFSTKCFERGEVVRPFDEKVGVSAVMEAAVVHLAGGNPEDKTKLAFALHMMKTFGDRDGLFLDLMES